MFSSAMHEGHLITSSARKTHYTTIIERRRRNQKIISQDRAMDVAMSTTAWAAENQAYVEADRNTIPPLSYAVSLLHGLQSYKGSLLIVL